MLIDTHCHLNDVEAFPDPAQAIAEAQEAGVQAFIVVGVDLESSQRAIDLAHQFECVYATVGWHPNYSASYTSDKLEELERLAQDPKVVAIGEIGLDFHWKEASFDQQRLALLDQLSLALKLNKPVIFHCRNAYNELIEILKQQPKNRFLFHCFSGNQNDADELLKLNCWFGVDGPITYKKADDLRTIVRTLPSNRILIETDSPWMAPHPFRGKPNHPSWLPYINHGLADTLGISDLECAELTTQNARVLFGI
jgi:TatD DNase family protein